MSKIKRVKSVRSKLSDDVAEKPARTLGRKRDYTRDAKILEAAIDILAEASFDGMTMDMVAARAEGWEGDGVPALVFQGRVSPRRLDLDERQVQCFLDMIL
jgi:hypothetical protein